ncbi:MAG: hypothetical protein WBP81_14335 [Solirubrobacteraceae bacterium]
MRVGLLALVAAIALAVSPVAVAANPVQIENAKPGDSYWMPATQDPASSAIEGYTTATSVRPGDSIGFHVSTSPAARYRIEIDRLGWYDGSGGRRVTCLVRAQLDAGWGDGRDLFEGHDQGRHGRAVRSPPRDGHPHDHDHR